MRKVVLGLAVLVVVGLGWSSGASADAVQWTVASGGNGHWYDIIRTGGDGVFNGLPTGGFTTWDGARADAEARGGHLATFTSAAEWAFFQTLYSNPTAENVYWLGGFQNTSSPSYSEPGGGWEWITGEPWTLNLWSGSEPNNSGAGGVENYLVSWFGDGSAFNDHYSPVSAGIRYGIEYDNDPTDTIVENRIHYYPFSGGPEDAAGAANGTLVGGAAVVAGELLLDGVDDYVQLGEHIVPTSGSYTVALFARQPIPQTGHRELISQGFSNGPGFYIGHNPLGVIRVSDSWLNTGVAYPSDGLWHHFAVAVDSTVGSTTLYVDGILQASVGFAIATTPAGTDTRFGQQFDDDEYFAGSLDEIRIYDRALSALEIGIISESDQDGDGLIDVFETNTGVYVDPTDTGTDPLNPDTDADGAIDGSDAFPLDPTETLDTDGDGTGNNADADDDGDGLTDTFEASIGTNPLLVDTDFDTLFDGVELADGTDPLLADTDGDNTDDATDNCPLTPNENQSDWDEDGLGNVCDPDPAPEPGELPLLLSGILLLSMMMARRRRVA